MAVITTILNGAKRAGGKLYDVLDNPETYKKIGRGISGAIDFTAEALDNDIDTARKLGRKMLDSDFFEDINKSEELKNIANSIINMDDFNISGISEQLKKGGVFKKDKQIDEIAKKIIESKTIDKDSVLGILNKNYDTGMSGYSGLITEEVIGRKLSPKGKTAAYGIAGAIAGIGVADGFDKGNQRVIMGDIDADREGVPNKVTENSSPVQLSPEAIEQTMKQQRKHIKDLGADGELGFALHKLYGTGQQKFI